MQLIAARNRNVASEELSITAAYMNEWFARQQTISGDMLKNVLNKPEKKLEKSDDEIGAAIMAWAPGDAEPLNLEDMVI